MSPARDKALRDADGLFAQIAAVATFTDNADLLIDATKHRKAIAAERISVADFFDAMWGFPIGGRR